ncbi:hypothetical protein HRbin36_01783 [bacterium HR36]|nr:hypothetical protein HRbin36_01783 [bacterium HR36]
MTVWLWLICGCTSTPRALLPELPLPPGRTELRVGGRYVFHSDVSLEAGHPVLREIAGLPERLQRELRLASENALVHVYLFADRGSYERYLYAHYGHLPPRRAFFMARPSTTSREEMLVFAFWGERILEDLRHELTHAELHSVCPNIPMWLDEGLAEFFEVSAEQDGLHYRHLAALRSELSSPWTPSLDRMEKLTLLRDMTPQDYREAWAWAHFLLRGPAPARETLLTYLRDLHQQARCVGEARQSALPALSTRLRQVVPDPEKALLAHLNEFYQRSQHLADVSARLETRCEPAIIPPDP